MAKYTEAQLKKKTLADLKKLAEPDYDLDGKETKADLIAALLSLGDDSEPEFDEEELDDEELPDEEELDEELDEPEVKPTKAARAKKTTTKPAKVSDDGSPALAAKQVATILGTEAKTLRQFFRSDASTFEKVGSGGRYEFTEADVPKIKEEFDAWKAAHASRGSKRGPNGTAGKTAKPVEELEEVEEIEELEEGELDDELEDEDVELEDED